MNIRPMLAIAAVVVALAGVATAWAAPPPIEDLALARAAIEHAVAAGAPQYAPEILRRARDELEHGVAALETADQADARRFAQDAQVDAELAAITARARRAEQALAGASPAR